MSVTDQGYAVDRSDAPPFYPVAPPVAQPLAPADPVAERRAVPATGTSPAASEGGRGDVAIGILVSLLGVGLAVVFVVRKFGWLRVGAVVALVLVLVLLGVALRNAVRAQVRSHGGGFGGAGGGIGRWGRAGRAVPATRNARPTGGSGRGGLGRLGLRGGGATPSRRAPARTAATRKAATGGAGKGRPGPGVLASTRAALGRARNWATRSTANPKSKAHQAAKTPRAGKTSRKGKGNNPGRAGNAAAALVAGWRQRRQAAKAAVSQLRSQGKVTTATARYTARQTRAAARRARWAGRGKAAAGKLRRGATATAALAAWPTVAGGRWVWRRHGKPLVLAGHRRATAAWVFRRQAWQTRTALRRSARAAWWAQVRARGVRGNATALGQWLRRDINNPEPAPVVPKAVLPLRRSALPVTVPPLIFREPRRRESGHDDEQDSDAPRPGRPARPPLSERIPAVPFLSGSDPALHPVAQACVDTIRTSIGGWHPPAENAQLDMDWFISSLGALPAELAGALTYLADHFVSDTPVDHEVVQWLRDTAAGCQSMSSAAEEEYGRWAQVAEYFLARAQRPRPAEANFNV